MKEKEILEIINRAGAVVNGHFRLNSGRHSGIYINKAAISFDPLDAFAICRNIADQFDGVPFSVETVVGPALGGIIPSFLVAFYLTISLDGPKVFHVYAEKEGEQFIIKREAKSLLLEGEFW